MRSRTEAAVCGQSLVELIISIAIVAILAGSVVGALLLSVRINNESINFSTASPLGQEVIDNVRSVSESDWPSLYSQSDKSSSSTYHINLDSTSTLSVATGTEEIERGGITYTRWFSIENVSRDSSGDIVESGGTEDTSTQKVAVHIEWQEGPGTASVGLTEYFTRWTRNESTVFTDWSGNSGIEGPITRPDNNFSATSGSIDLSTQGEIKIN
ncbi:MAG: hypothetical protein A3C03_00535 [Candidatus Colwellbacteria bacterium RIFCSPHIGHO2_02_FULL_45_17]|uniref:Uncharacterized protein n=2 Tax=Candidatus Colwelliibacteriota TaxID=1817904 RepID=A0A1G1ZEX9_9BACT|nr:MAG: hypothetical protein A3C03_00535 [Candidatus Colwellbacteria bacterium RIFCSPHIGHO2_02_FULL_45_17]OGY60511.1 MAG: hypothetical protein A3I33_02710 [Candidatus Colwellbacteria bacterium RIFCSPLOWO2_02_FULL_45_11]OGY62397.1 MAG: hypothetical protein A3G58_01090 [Candidatus Colwellbacteria bacterium RIFCSPLOWO2_12_FULL_46_17]